MENLQAYKNTNNGNKVSQLLLKYTDNPQTPQIVLARRKKNVVGEYMFFQTPVRLNGQDFHYMTHFYPTDEILFAKELWQCIDILETQYRFHHTFKTK